MEICSPNVPSQLLFLLVCNVYVFPYSDGLLQIFPQFVTGPVHLKAFWGPGGRLGQIITWLYRQIRYSGLLNLGIFPNTTTHSMLKYLDTPSAYSLRYLVSRILTNPASTSREVLDNSS